MVGAVKGSRLVHTVVLLLCQTIWWAQTAHGSPISGKPSPADEFKVTDLPGLDKLPEIPVMHAGHLEVDPDSDTNYFFWKFQKPAGTPDNRTVFWLNGGPGCSSMDGALMEVGPLRINKHLEVEFNNGSWYEAGDLVFVDQPGGTGFSYTDDYVTELDQVAAKFLKFLEKYFELFPADLSNDMYLAGESYAGQYIPYIAKAVSEMDEKKYNLKSLLIGNGWVSPNEQSLTYVPYLLQAGLISSTDEFFPDLLKRQEKCQNAINKGETTAISVCEDILDAALGYTRDKSAADDQQCINIYDYTLKDSFPSCGMNWPPLLPEVNKFLRDDKIMDALNLKKHRQWNECDSSVSRFLKAKHSKQAVEYLPALLAQYDVVLFNGNRDIICNYLGTELMISHLDWAGSHGFGSDVEYVDWFYDGANVGSVRSADNLTFINVYNASHMVPFDNSVVSRGVMDIAVGNTELVEGGLKTPIYPASGGREDGGLSPDHGNGNSTSGHAHQGNPDGYDNLTLSHSVAFYVFEVLVVFIIMYGIHYFYVYYNDISSRRPASILHSGNRNSNGISGTAKGNAKNASGKKSKKVHWLDELDFETGTDASDSKDAKDSIVSQLWSKISTTYTKIPAAETREDIEMSGGARATEEFIIESDDEDQDQDQDVNSHA